MTSFRKVFRSRALILFLVIALLFVTDIGRLFYIQVVKGEEYADKAQSQQLSDTEIEANRGTIYDSEGNILAQSATVWTVFLDPSNITDDNRQTIVDYLASAFEYDDEQKQELLEKSKADGKYQVVEKNVENRLKEEIAAFVSDNKLSLCIGFEEGTRRYYPYGKLASSVIGFTGADNQGLAGIEAYYNEQLTGTNGRVITAKDAKSNSISNDYETSYDAQDGYSLKLTINTTIQYYLEKELERTLNEYSAKGCYGVVMDCNTGAVLAMASLPDYDCNDPYEITYEEYQKELDSIQDETQKTEKQSEYIQRQWRNFIVSDTYVPGSVFKTFMASAVLEEGVATLDTKYTCTGSIKVDKHIMHCHYHPGHGTQTLTQGLENSCNPFFITLGQKLGVHNYYKYFNGFGFTEKTGIDVPGEASPQYYKEDEYGIVELSSASFGQTNSLTPIQVCTGLCAIANGGKLLTPYVVSEITDENGNTVSKTQPNVVRQVISEDTSKKVCKMMQSVVDNGTGKNGYVAGYRVGGKTGTSTKLGESKPGEKDKYIVSFAAIAPADDPQIAMLIICDEPNVDLGGGAICAPIAATVIEESMAELGIEPVYTDEEKKDLSVSTPAVIGKSAKEAENTIKNAGLEVKVVGDGDKVLNQSPASGATIPSGGTVVIYTEDTEKQTVKVPDFAGLTVAQANRLAASNNINLEISGNTANDALVVAYKQSEDAGKEVEIGTVVTVSFKSTQAVLD